MGIKKLIVGTLLTTAVTTVVSKISEDRVTEKELETESQKEINKEQEETKRQMIEEQSEARRWKQSTLLREAREKIPIAIECPYCNGVREIDRIAGVVRCPYCEKVESLPAVHLYDEDLDGKTIKNIEAPQVSQNKRLKMDTMGKASLVLGLVSLMTLGILIIPNIASIALGLNIVNSKDDGAITPETTKNAIKGIIFGAISFVIMILYHLNG